jgi:hypothetical protein
MTFIAPLPRLLYKRRYVHDIKYLYMYMHFNRKRSSVNYKGGGGSRCL